VTRKRKSVGSDELESARYEASRRVAARERSEARGILYEALFITAKGALAQVYEPPPGASDGTRVALDERRHEAEDLLEDVWEALPREIDEQALEAQIAAGTAGDVDFEPVTNKKAFARPHESSADVVARVLVEQGHSETSAIAAARGLTSAEATNSGARRTLRRSRAAEREWHEARPGKLSASEEAELEAVMEQAEPERRARLARRSARRRSASGLSRE
jgi:hypothetical protein